MSSAKKRRGLIVLGISVIVLVAARLMNEYAVFCWGWVLFSLSFGWLALTRVRLGLVQALLVGGAMLNAAAGVANGLVMTANGGRMPVETVSDWSRAPAFLDGHDPLTEAACSLLVTTDETLKPEADDDMHVDAPLPHIVRFGGSPKRPSARPPTFAALDDREGVTVCGAPIVYSKGDALGFMGSCFWALGVPLLLLRTLWRRVRRKAKAPAG